MSQLGQLESEIRSLGVEPVAIAVTAVFSQQAFAASLGVSFPMLSDWEGSAAWAYGVQYEVWKGHVGLAKRSVFVVDRDGYVRYRWITDDALIEPDLEEVLAALRQVAGDRA